MSRIDQTYLTLKYGPLQATSDYINSLPPIVVDQYVSVIYSTNTYSTDDVVRSLSIKEYSDLRRGLLLRILTDYHEHC